MTDPLLDASLWRVLIHAIVPIILAASTNPGDSKNGLRFRLSVAASFIIEGASQIGVDINSVADMDLTELIRHAFIGLVGQQTAYEVADKALIPDGLKLNELIGVGRTEYEEGE